MASQSIDDILHQFLIDNDIPTTDERKVIEVLKNLGIKDEKSLSYLADLREDDISNEKTGKFTLLDLLLYKGIVTILIKTVCGSTRRRKEKYLSTQMGP